MTQAAQKLAQPRPWVSLPELDEGQFLQWRQLLATRGGIHIPAERRDFLASGLRERMRATGCGGYQAYFDYLQEGRRLAEWSLLVDRITVHETRFFRHPPSFRLLRDRLLPDFLAAEPDHGFHAWSIGCATGEEAYSLAMLLDEALAERDAGYGVTATDLSQPALRRAREARYPVRRLEDIEPGLRDSYCVAEADGGFRICATLRRRVCFARQNIVELDDFPLERLDLIFCQNMLIYFPRETRCSLLDRLVGRLRPGGVMVLGPADVPAWAHPEMERIRFAGTLAYRRRGAATDGKG
ncbi:protein-glutamate O-methyltransferase CheR [Thiohalobacter sp. IOR34]|uniref:CheR family methyltransferase n=1 Tax=Thiohalobacter sp. IOR34 TaxID=3057176 RepID=UPI0025B074EE|nr:protein-glutamate O-methyltransferase CheR [Thiohalobacter sp. IOR34]WJW75795.1 protein-glutamate O-methyltransferase CheR [Thiohalobacter sp. IOR34]